MPPKMMHIGQNRRRLWTFVGLAGILVLIWTPKLVNLGWESDYSTWSPEKKAPSTNSQNSVSDSSSHSSDSSLIHPSHVQDYFEQAFSIDHPRLYGYSALKEACSHAKAVDNDVYLQCGGMAAGLTSIISQVKVCLKMAVDSGSNIILPSMPLRDSQDLKEFNFLNGQAYLNYGEWFDADHLREQMARACPKIKIAHPEDLETKIEVKRKFIIRMDEIPGYRMIHSFFWVGRPFSTFFRKRYAELVAEDEKSNTPRPKNGATIIDIDSKFLLFKITDDPTRRELHLWNDLSHLVRFHEEPRRIVDRLVTKLNAGGPFFGVHFRVENDTIWSSLEHQLQVDLDALDRAWAKFGKSGAPKPVVYLACGDSNEMEKFVSAGAERGWQVTHKWRLLEDDRETTDLLNALAFDFQGAVDLGIMVRSAFFMGISGSAFSSTIGNLRDVTGRYRGSSLELDFDDEGARTHLFNDLDAEEYPCCL